MLLQSINLNTGFISAKNLAGDNLYGKHRATVVQNRQGHAILLGGYGDSQDSLQSVHALDMLTKSYRNVGNLLVPRADFAAAIQADGNSEQVFCFGGTRIYNFGSERELLSSIELYNLNTGISATLDATIPSDLGVTGQFCAKLNDNLLMLAGGVKTNGEGSDAIYVFDMATRRWLIQGKRLPLKMAYGATALHQGRVLMFGGINLTSGQASSNILYWKPSNLVTTL